MSNISRKLTASVAILGMIGAALMPSVSSVDAAGFAQASVRLDRLSTTATTGGRVCAKPSAAALSSTEGKVLVTFPTGFTVNSTASNWTVTTTGLDSGQTAWPGIGTATAVSGQTVTFASGDLSSSSTLYCFNFASSSTLTTPGSTGNNLSGTIETQTAGSTQVDTAQYALSIISNDQIVVSASVGATFTFALSGNTDSFGGNLDPAQVNSTTGRTATMTTNAAQGWILWAKSANGASGDATKGALKSTSANRTIPLTNAKALGSASAVFSAGTEDYGLAAILQTDAAGGGTVSIDAAYSSNGSDSKAGVLGTGSFRPVASADGTSAGDVVTLKELATITNGTPAATDYTDTITLVAAGQF